MSEWRDHAADVALDLEKGIKPTCTCTVHTKNDLVVVDGLDEVVARLDTWVEGLEIFLQKIKEENKKLKELL